MKEQDVNEIYKRVSESFNFDLSKLDFNDEDYNGEQLIEISKNRVESDIEDMLKAVRKPNV